MPRIRCHYNDCVFLDEGYCSAAQAEVDPDAGCMTYNPTAEEAVEDDWDEDEEAEEWEELEDEEEEEEDMWADDEEEDY